MLPTVRAVFRNGKIELLEQMDLPEGAEVLVTRLSPGEDDFWQTVGQVSADEIWGSPEDDIYGQLLKE